MRYVGVSNWAAWQIMKALGIAERLGLARFQSLQAYYTIAGRDLERELVPMLQSEGLGLMVWSPLAGGFLSGKYGRDQAGEAGSRRTAFDFPPVDKERAYDVDRRRCARSPTARGVSVAQIALAWLLHQPAVTSVIIGAKKPEQLADNIGATATSRSTPTSWPGSTRSASCRPNTRAGCSRARARSGASRSPTPSVRRPRRAPESVAVASALLQRDHLAAVALEVDRLADLAHFVARRFAAAQPRAQALPSSACQSPVPRSRCWCRRRSSRSTCSRGASACRRRGSTV